MVNKENFYREYKGHINWLGLINSQFPKKYSLLHAHAHYTCIVCTRGDSHIRPERKDPVKELAPYPYISIIKFHLVDINVFVKFYEIQSLPFQGKTRTSMTDVKKYTPTSSLRDNTGASLQDSIYHMTLKLHFISTYCTKTLRFY